MDINDDFSFPSISTHFNNPVSQLSISTSLWRISSLIYPDFDGGGEDSGRSSSKGPDSCKMDMLWEDLEALDVIIAEAAAEMVVSRRPLKSDMGDVYTKQAAKTIHITTNTVVTQQPKRDSGKTRLVQMAINKIFFCITFSGATRSVAIMSPNQVTQCVRL